MPEIYLYVPALFSDTVPAVIVGEFVMPSLTNSTKLVSPVVLWLSWKLLIPVTMFPAGILSFALNPEYSPGWYILLLKLVALPPAFNKL